MFILKLHELVGVMYNFHFFFLTSVNKKLFNVFNLLQGCFLENTGNKKKSQENAEKFLNFL